MPKKSGRSRRRIIKGKAVHQLVLSTLADDTLVGANLGTTVNTRSFLGSVEATWAMNGHTAGEGPLIVGIAHSDYSDAEVEEYLENAGSWDEGDLVAQEIARRKIRIVGTFSGQSTDEVLNDGKPLKTKAKWMLSEGDTVKIWCYNTSGGALTTGTQINLDGHVWLFPT